MPKNAIRAFVLLLAAGLAVYFVWPRQAGQDSPWYRWVIGDGGDKRNYQEVAADTEVRLELALRSPAYVYVASHNGTDGTIALFPSPWLDTDLGNPLPPGTHVLPGRFEGTGLAWPVRATLGATDYLAVVSDEPVAELEDLFESARQISNTTFPDHRMVVTAPRGRSMDDVPRRASIPGKLLPAAGAIAVESLAGALRPWGEDESILLTSMKVIVKEAPGAPPSGK